MASDIGLLILRVIVGLVLVGHGAQKLFGWFGGPGLNGTSGWISSMRLRPPGFWAFMAGLSELGGGLLLTLGLLSPLGTLGISAAMLMAIILAHWPKFWAAEGGYELPLLNLAAAIAIGITGPGRYALDTVLGIALPAPASLVAGLILVLLGIGTALTSRAPQVRTETGGQAASHAHGRYPSGSPRCVARASGQCDELTVPPDGHLVDEAMVPIREIEVAHWVYPDADWRLVWLSELEQGGNDSVSGNLAQTMVVAVHDIDGAGGIHGDGLGAGAEFGLATLAIGEAWHARAGEGGDNSADECRFGPSGRA